MDSVCKDTGNSRYDLHEQWKARIMPFLAEDPSNFIEEIVPELLTTVTLSDKGWEIFYSEWKHFCIQTFNIGN